MAIDGLGPGPTIDDYFGRLSQTLAARTPRRSFLGKLGTITIAAGVGTVVGGAGAALWAEPSSIQAACHDGQTACASTSAYCGCSNTHNASCPSGTCECGCWLSCPSSTYCGVKTTRFCDCCISNGGGCSSSCPCGPRCCFTKEWSGGCGTSSWIIRCRVTSCGPSGCA